MLTKIPFIRAVQLIIPLPYEVMYNFPMAIGVKKARRLIGRKESGKYTDEQVSGIIRNFTVLADIAIDNYTEKRKQVKLGRQESNKKGIKN